jgi:hypothetical protein
VSDGLPDPRTEPAIDVERAGALCGFRRTKAYTEANRYLDTNGAEGLPVLRFGSRLVCPTARVLAMLGFDVDVDVDVGSSSNGNGSDATKAAVLGQNETKAASHDEPASVLDHRGDTRDVRSE